MIFGLFSFPTLRQRRKQLLVMRKQLKEQRPYKSCCPKRCQKLHLQKAWDFLRKVDDWWLDFRCFFLGAALIFRGSWSTVETRWEEPRLLQLFEERRQRYDLDFGRLRELKPRAAAAKGAVGTFQVYITKANQWNPTGLILVVSWELIIFILKCFNWCLTQMEQIFVAFKSPLCPPKVFASFTYPLWKMERITTATAAIHFAETFFFGHSLEPQQNIIKPPRQPGAK